MRFGHELKDFFSHSRVFHAGGDEFVAVLRYEDYENREALLKEFALRYGFQQIEHEGAGAVPFCRYGPCR